MLGLACNGSYFSHVVYRRELCPCYLPDSTDIQTLHAGIFVICKVGKNLHHSLHTLTNVRKKEHKQRMRSTFVLRSHDSQKKKSKFLSWTPLHKTNCLSVFDHFVGLTLKGLTH